MTTMEYSCPSLNKDEIPIPGDDGEVLETRAHHLN